ncbi:MAG: DUF4097 domain-containing protein [Planctomycetes bacterium]|nr:DUF4097 domain-containing protein [Planctomycetota bacterium]
MMRVKEMVGLVVVAITLWLPIGGCIIVHDGEWEGGFWSHRAKFERTVELQHAMPTGGTLVVSTSSGSIETTGQETDQVQVVAKITARAATEEEAQQLAEQVQVRFQESGDKLEIKADKPTLRRSRISISYNITTPRQTSLDCESGSGSLKMRDLTGNVHARTGSGSVEAARIKGAVRLRSGSGSVHAENVGGGDVDLDTGSGGVRLSEASEAATCRAHSSSGPVHVQHVQAKSIRMDSGSGGVTGEDLNCAKLNAGSGSGHVTAAFSPSAPNNLVADVGSGSGGIRVVLPPGFAGRVDLSVGSGSVHIDQPITVRGDLGKRHIVGTIGEGAGSLSAHTGSGSIEVR